ncbi:MAG TPA: HAMP domain-containing sensor histidine kinase [Gemmatimonadaceae bacterium]|jgi:hypothetical protein
MPRLSEFIREHTENILDAWETLARELSTAEAVDVASLRDHARVMLTIIARDLDTPQTEIERVERARGARDSIGTAEVSAAGQLGLGRATRGFSVASMLAEFRALRASVIKLWRETQTSAGPEELEQMTRFNEAIDQAIAESIARYTDEVETTRDRFFAVLGHDLRTPLSVISMSSQFLLDTADLNEEQLGIVAGMKRSSQRMIELVRDLLDLALTRLGHGMPVRPSEMDLGALVRDVVEEATTSSPGSEIEVETQGMLVGHWDRARLAQALGNLVSNAVQHGAPKTPIRVAACGENARTVTVSVANKGLPIPPDHIAGIFGAMKGNSGGDRRHLGLGLYIVDKIVDAHGGSIDVRSSDEEGTRFIITLPRHARGMRDRAP